MNENNSLEDTNTSLQPKNSKYTSKKILIVVILVLLIMALSIVTYLFVNENNTTKELTQKVSQIENQQPSTENGTATNTDATNSDGKISYVAEVGAFSLNLPNNYRIVEYIDGAGEGGKATQIDVAVSSNKGAATVDNFAYKKVSVSATPKENFSTLESLIQSKISEGDEYKKLENITISGVDAQVYEVPGLDVITYYFFEKNDIHYVITNESSDAVKITDVLNGFSFVY
jgi:cytoskeletal protein RodZ